MFKYFLVNKAGTPLDVQVGLADHQTLMVESHRVLDAHWKSSPITTATTTTIITSRPNESVMLTDLVVILSKKVAASTIVVRFNDGTNTAILFTFDSTVDSFFFSHAFQGGIRSWKNANFQIVTDQATTVTVFVGYVHISEDATKSYAVWNAER